MLPVVGVARRDVTPPLTTHARSWGAAPSDFMSGRHQPLTLTALTLGSTAVLVALDGSWWRTKADEERVRLSAAQTLGMPPEAIFLALSHTHAGPTLHADVPGGAEYLTTLRDALVAAVTEARAAAEHTLIEWTTGWCNLATNRDLPEPNGPGTLVGWNPDLPADNTVSIARISDTRGRPFAILVHYACHPTTLGPENRVLSPDYIGPMREVIEKATHVPCLFLQGASGELAPAEQYSADTRVAERHGRQLGYAVLSALEGMGRCNNQLIYDRRLDSGAPLALHRWEVKKTGEMWTGEWERKDISLALKPEISAVAGAEGDEAAQERAHRAALIRASVGDGPETTVSLHTMTLGHRTLVGIPGEAYSTLQQDVDKERKRLICNCVNGWLGHFPPRAIYAAPAVYAARTISLSRQAVMRHWCKA
ncbi:MAG: hypothetical protein QM758_19590 [Armatimonas sp.]